MEESTYKRYLAWRSESCWIRFSAPCSLTTAGTSSKKVAGGILPGESLPSFKTTAFAAAMAAAAASVAALVEDIGVQDLGQGIA